MQNYTIFSSNLTLAGSEFHSQNLISTSAFTQRRQRRLQNCPIHNNVMLTSVEETSAVVLKQVVRPTTIVQLRFVRWSDLDFLYCVKMVQVDVVPVCYDMLNLVCHWSMLMCSLCVTTC